MSLMLSIIILDLSNCQERFYEDGDNKMKALFSGNFLNANLFISHLLLSNFPKEDKKIPWGKILVSNFNLVKECFKEEGSVNNSIEDIHRKLIIIIRIL